MQLKNSELFFQGHIIDGKKLTKDLKLEVLNPANNQVLGTISKCNEVETKQAIDAAQKALKTWKKTNVKERSQILKKWYDLIIENSDDLALILTSEQGKPLAEAKGEVLYGASFVEWFSEEVKRSYGDTIPASKDNQKIITFHEAIGVVAAITPWNFPSAMVTRKAAAAIAAGCSVVLKPSELTPFSAFALAILAQKAGLPDGVLNIIAGDYEKIGDEICANKLVRKISFTGSTNVGKLLNQKSAYDLKRVSLELGGSAPFIIFEDAILEKVIPDLMHAKFRNGGQACTCVNRIFVHKNIHDKFIAAFKEEVAKLKVGNGLNNGVNIGPMINNSAIEKVERLVNDAKNKGAQTIIGGTKFNEIGELFYAPTILTNISSDMQIAHEEIFGAVAAIQIFNSEEEVIELANNTNYGLGSYIYGQNNSQIWRVADSLEFGMVAVNGCSFATEVAPFGGIKDSGFGREGSYHGLREFQQLKTLHISF